MHNERPNLQLMLLATTHTCMLSISRDIADTDITNVNLEGEF